MPSDLSTEVDAAPLRRVSSEEETKVNDLLRWFYNLTIWRNTFAGQWEEAANLLDPNSRNTFFYQSFNWPGFKKTFQQVDASGSVALERFVAIAQSLVTPKGQLWHGLRAGPDRDYLMKNRDVRLWYEDTARKLFQHRYATNANFDGQNSAHWRGTGAYGNATMFIDAFDSRRYGGARGFRYKAVPLGEMFFGENHQGKVDRCVRWFRMPAYQAAERWGLENLPDNLRPALTAHSQWPYNFLHCVRPRGKDYDPEALDHRGMPFESYYISIEGKCFMQKPGGYRVFPYAVSRYAQAPNEVYGRGPAQLVLPALKTLNAEKTVFLKQGHRAADPILLLADDGIVGMDMRPGAKNVGGVSPEGKPLVHTLPTGDIHLTKEMMEEERALIDDMFLVSLFKVLSDHPNMTATQVIELVNEKGMLVAPTLGRQHTEYVGGMVERELDLGAYMGVFEPMPPMLREARGDYEIEDTSPLALARRAGQAAGFLRLLEQLREAVNITQDPSILYRLNFDRAVPELAAIGGVPERWLSSDDEVEAKQQAAARAQAQKQQIDAMPAQAAIIKARAVAAKAVGAGMPGQQTVQ